METKTRMSKQQSPVLAIVIAATLMIFVVSLGHTQEMHRIAGKIRAENSKYTQQYTIDVGDVPHHRIRIFELHHRFTQDAPVFEGVRAVERWTRGFMDMINKNGSGELYAIYLLENGDKVLTKGKSVVEATAESTKSKATYISIITGGTGKLLGIRGVIEITGAIDPKAGFADLQFEGEYWLQK